MRYFDKLNFGKYKEHRIIDVYQGSFNVKKDDLTQYVKYLIKEGELLKNYLESNTVTGLECIKSIEINDNFIKIIRTDNAIPTFSYKEFENILEKFLTIGNYPITNNSSKGIISFNKYVEIKGNSNLVNSNASYIYWCIAQVSGFYLQKEDIELLDSLRTINFTGFLVVYRGDDTFEFTPKFNVGKSTFPEKIKEINQNKLTRKCIPSNFNNNINTHSEFNGAYGYDDDTINDAFEGNPENYWNID